MSIFVFANNLSTTLASGVNSSATTLLLSSSANLPTLTLGQILPITLNDAATGLVYEIAYAVAITGASLTVLRGQEGTTATGWQAGDFALCCPTAQAVGPIIGSLQPTVSGTLPAGNNVSVQPGTISAGISLALPSTVAVGSSYTVFGSASAFAVIVTTASSMKFPDGTSATSWVVPAYSPSRGLTCIWDGTNWRCQTFGWVDPSSYSQRYPAILTAGNILTITAGGSNTIAVGAGQSFVFRDSVLFGTGAGWTSPATSASQTYHLRFVFKTESGRANLGTSFYAAKSIADGSFYLINVIDSAYNSGALTESNSALDTLLDDMLCARIVTNGSNIATITSLANADRLINRTMISGSALNQIPWGVWSGGSFILNWSRIPALSVPTFEAVKHQNSEITDGTEWGLIGQGALAVFGIRVTSGSLTRYGGTLDYVYDDVDTHNQGWFHVNCVSEA